MSSMSYVFLPFGKNIHEMRQGSEQRETAIDDIDIPYMKKTFWT
jgi:hypothetical protein